MHWLKDWKSLKRLYSLVTRTQGFGEHFIFSPFPHGEKEMGWPLESGDYMGTRYWPNPGRAVVEELSVLAESTELSVFPPG